MADHLPIRRPEVLGIPLASLARHAVNDAVSAITQPYRLRIPREGSYEEFITAAEYNDRVARRVSIDVLERVNDLLGQPVDYTSFDRYFLNNPNNAAMHGAYTTARDDYPNDLDAELVRAWATKQREWEAAAAISGYGQHQENGDVAGLAIGTEIPQGSRSIMRSLSISALRRSISGAMARIIAFTKRKGLERRS